MYAGSPAGSQHRRKFLTQREFQQLQISAKCPSEVGPLPASSRGVFSGDKPSVSFASKPYHDSPDGGMESEVETQISDCSELPSSASAVATVQFQHAGHANEMILSEVERLRQENLALRSENAELRSIPAQPPMLAAVPPTQSGILSYAISPSQAAPAPLPPPSLVSPTGIDYGHLAHGSSPTACQQHLRFGAPLRYVVVASPVGMHTGNFEVGFDASDVQRVWHCG